MHNVAQAECCFEERSEFVIFVTPGDVLAPHETFNDVSMQRLLRCFCEARGRRSGRARQVRPRTRKPLMDNALKLPSIKLRALH